MVEDHRKTCIIRSPCAIKLRQRLESNVVGVHRNCENVAGKKYCLVDEVNENVNTIFSICSRYLRVGTDFDKTEKKKSFRKHFLSFPAYTLHRKHFFMGPFNLFVTLLSLSLQQQAIDGKHYQNSGRFILLFFFLALIGLLPHLFECKHLQFLTAPLTRKDLVLFVIDEMEAVAAESSSVSVYLE